MKQCGMILAVVLLLATVSFGQEADQVVKKSSWGAGFGIPYGVLGTNMDYNVAPNLNLSMGFGTTVIAGMGYSFGAKYYLASPETSFRPRLSGFYGTNTAVQEGFFDEGSTYAGLNFGLGAQWMWGGSRSNGIDFDVIYIASTSYSGTEDLGKVKISVGYRHGL